MSVKDNYQKYMLKRRSLRYPLDEIPQDYFFYEDITVIQDFFYDVFVEGMSVDEAFSSLKSFYNISITRVKNKMMNDGYIELNFNYDKLDEILDSYPPKKLKKILKTNGLDVPKSVEDRKALIKNEIPQKFASEELTISDKGKNYYNDTKNKISLFIDCCDDFFYYHEYLDLCFKNPDRTDEENLLDFINLHYDVAVDRKDFGCLCFCFETNGYFYGNNEENYEKAVDEFIQEFIVRINHIFLPQEYYDAYEPLEYEININFVAATEKLSKDYILSRFESMWDDFSLDYLVVEKEDALNYLNQMLEDDEVYEKINKSYRIV